MKSHPNERHKARTPIAQFCADGSALRVRRGTVALAFVLVLASAPALAATVSIGSTGTFSRVASSVVPTGATAKVETHTQSTNSPTRTNQTVVTTENGAAIPSAAIPSITVDGGIGDFFFDRTYNNAVSSGNRNKQHPYTLTQTNNSQSSIATSFGTFTTKSRAEAAVQTLGTPTVPTGQTALSVSQQVQVNRTAAALAEDPWFFDGGTSTDISYVLGQGISLFSEEDAIGFSEGGFEAYVTTSVSGLETAWRLGVGVVGALDDPTDLLVVFESAPSLSLNDAVIESLVRSAFSFSSGSGFTLLSDLALPTITVASDEAFSVAAGVQVFGQANVVPLPLPAWLLLAALCALLPFRRRTITS